MAPLKRTHKADLNIPREISQDSATSGWDCATWLQSPLPILGTDRQLHLKRRAFARRRHHPDPASMHLHDLLGDGEPEARAALGLGKRAIDLVELIEDPTLLVERYAGPGVCYRDGETAVSRRCGDAHLAGVGKLNGVPDEIEEYLREALFVPEANRERLVHGCRERELLVLSERLGGRAHGFDYALDRVFGHVEGELAGFDLGDVEHGIDEAQQVLAVGADAHEDRQGFLGQRAIDAFLQKFGIAEHCCQRSSKLMTHVGDEL